VSPNNSPFPADDLLQLHPPERGERKKKYVVLYSCCCCCCCCLHTLGGAIGAVVAGNYCPERDEWDESPEPAKRLPCSQWMYWSSFLFACLAGGVIGGLANPSQFSEALIVVGLSIVILGPAWFLAASGLSALQIAFRQDLPSKNLYWRQLGKITGGMLAGSVLGVLAMILIGVAIMGLGGH
jgi:hypothetical protein